MRGSANYEKLAAAGFTTVRADDQPSPRIKKWTGESSWTTMETFPTKAARDRRLLELLADPKTITDIVPPVPYLGVAAHEIRTVVDFIDDSLERYHSKKDLKEVLTNAKTILSVSLDHVKDNNPSA